MPNQYFKFKQFTIYQDKCAMKVCTDACLFGALVADEIQDRPVIAALDIGTGTGLLPLMLAQKNRLLHIDTVEIDYDAHLQSKSNFESSSFREQLNPVFADFNTYQTSAEYGLIISNPPFFENDLKSEDEKEIAAKHSSSLTLKELISNSIPLLAKQGIMAILLPYSRKNEFEELAEKKGLFPFKKISISQSRQHGFFRIIYFLSAEKRNCKEEQLAIRENKNEYTNEFASLLKDYYLYL